jgi:hypothetical protein
MVLEYVVSNSQISAIRMTLPHLSPPLTKGRDVIDK